MDRLSLDEIRELLDSKHDQYNRPEFVENDPIGIPHLFSIKEDIEISAFLTATMAWGNRASIVKSAKRLMKRMDFSPFGFVRDAGSSELKRLDDFVHRTFQAADLKYFTRSLQRIYGEKGGLEQVVNSGFDKDGLYGALVNLRKEMLFHTPGRTARHVSDVSAGSAAKRLNLFLMWMVRKDRRGVHFGIWNRIPMSELRIPLDTHVGRVARMLGLLHRMTNDWKAVEELTAVLRLFDPEDPCKYDFSLFGLGLFDKF